MKSKILSFLSAFVLLISGIPTARAADNPRMLLTQDCNTLEKRVLVGYQSYGDGASSGPEIILIQTDLTLTPTGTTTLDDLRAAKLSDTKLYGNLAIVSNTADIVGGAMSLKATAGFTDNKGYDKLKDLFFISGITEKSFQIAVKSAKLVQKSNNADIYKGPAEQFSADPASCKTSNSGAPPAAPQGPTTIAINTDKNTAKVGEKVSVTATIKNRNGAPVDWVQTSGARITPDINNETVSETETKSTLSFSMPETTEIIALKIKIGAVSADAGIAPDRPLPPPEPAPVISAPEPPAVAEESGTLAERLAQRRLEESENADTNETEAIAGNIHGSAEGLSNSGPASLLAITALVSGLAAAAWKKRTRSL